jgi:Trk-type K+ transport system membrane component
MEYLIVISIVALATGFSSMYELIIPTIKTLEQEDPGNIMLENKTLTYVTCFLLSVLTFPLLLPMIIFGSDKFKHRLLESFKDIKIPT